MYYIIRWKAVRLLMDVAEVLVVQPLFAQNNPYKISDRLYSKYVRAYSQRASMTGVAISDTLYSKAQLFLAVLTN